MFVALAADYCFGIPYVDPEDPIGFPETWRRTDFDLKLKEGKGEGAVVRISQPTLFLRLSYCPIAMRAATVSPCLLACREHVPVRWLRCPGARQC